MFPIQSEPQFTLVVKTKIKEFPRRAFEKVFLQDIRNSFHRGLVLVLGIHLLSSKVMPSSFHSVAVVHLLPSERAALCKPGLATGGLAKHS